MRILRLFGSYSRALSIVALGLALLSISTVASAQERTFYLDRAQISGAPDDGFMVWRPFMHERTRFYGMAALGYTHRPLRAETLAANQRTADQIEDPIQGQFITYLSVGTEIASRFGFNVSLPVAVYQFRGEDPAPRVGGGFDTAAVAMHDLRLDGRVKMHESDNRKFRLGLGGAAWVPTGDPESFTSDRSVSGWLYGSGEYDFGKFLLSGMLGPHFRPERGISGGSADDFALSSEMRWAVGGYIPLREGKIRLGAELWGTTGLTEAEGKSTFFAEKNTDVEWLAQARFALGQQQRTWLMAGGGTRLSAGYGAPDFRILASIGHWFTLKDVEPKSPPPKLKIVPDVEDYDKDTDGDGYPDSIDKCPTIKEDGKEPDPTDGCPQGSDRDGDGIPDDADSCPDVPEDKDGIEDTDGCPEKDADNDKIPDTEDKCPTEPGPRRADAEKNGCPGLTKVDEDGNVALLEPIQFDTGKATIKPVSFPILDEVVILMQSRTNIRMGIYGHTDSVGKDDDNLRLSKARAASVVDYIAKKGIARNRLESEGFGETKPVAPDTPAGRAKNRRVDFQILDD